MTHTPAQRKAWHANKLKNHRKGSWESKGAIVARMLNKDLLPTDTPAFLKRGITYAPLPR